VFPFLIGWRESRLILFGHEFVSWARLGANVDGNLFDTRIVEFKRIFGPSKLIAHGGGRATSSNISQRVAHFFSCNRDASSCGKSPKQWASISRNSRTAITGVRKDSS